MDYILYSLYFILYTFISAYRFHYGLFLLFLLLPTYMIRFSIGPLPTTLLEGMIWILLIIWLFKEVKIQNKKKRKVLISYLLSLIKRNKLLFVGSVLFLLAATISIFTAVDTRPAAGEWKAFYIEPFLVFLIIISEFRKKNSSIFNLQSSILFALILSGLATSILAIYQHFTSWMVPHAFWANRDTFRVTAWYGFPNGVGLFLAPLVPLALYLTYQNWKKTKYIIYHISYITSILFLLTAPLAIFFAKSTGSLVGIAAGIGILLLFNKKTRWPAIILGIIGLVSLLSISSLSGLKDEVFLQDRSGQIRIAMWKEAGQLLRERPILGAGLASYEERIEPYHTTVNGEGIEIFHHPHNLFLTIWFNTGLLGLIGFILILLWFLVSITYHLSPIYKKKNMFDYLPIFLLATMVTILTTGLVDSPYIKNDLAVFFWLILALVFSTAPLTKPGHRI